MYFGNLHDSTIPLAYSDNNTLKPKQNGHHFADDTFKRILLNKNVRISNEIFTEVRSYLQFGPINNIPALV